MAPASPPDLPQTPLTQSALYAGALGRMGCTTTALDLGGGFARLIPRQFGPLKVALLPGGPVWHTDAAPRDRQVALARLAKSASFLITNSPGLSEDHMLADLGHVPLITGQFTARLDLTVPRPARRAALAQKWRNRLNRAECVRLDTTLARFDAARHGWILTAESEQRRARGYRALPPAFVVAASQVDPGATLVASARAGGENAAAMVFLIHGDTATYLIGHSTATGRRMNAHTLLLWRAANHLADRGIARLDLGVIDTETHPGIARFKLGSGAVPHQLGATCLHTRATAPLGRAARLIHTAVRGIAGQTDRSCR